MKRKNLHLVFPPALIIFFLLTFHSSHSKITTAPVASPDLETIRARIISDLLEPGVDKSEIELLVKTVQPDGSWPNINYKDVSRTAFQHSIHLENMLALSRAYKKSGSKFYNNAEVKKTALAALDFWIAHDFICDNWWWNEMGTPSWMVNTLLILDTDLTEKQRVEGSRIAGRANLEASGARPGGDLIQIAGMLGKQALFKRDEETLERVVKVMASEIKVTTGRGLKPDMSFHHRVDNVISTLSYGSGYANAFSYWAVKIAGTKFNFPEEAMKLLIDYYLDGICKSMVYGKFADPGARNRDLSRKETPEGASPVVAENLLKASDYRRSELEDVIKIRKGEKVPIASWDRFFWHSEYYTHQRPGYFSSVRMHSSRNFTMEQPHNEEGLKNHHFGDGSSFVSITGKEYAEIFPVWDWQKIPGTTVVQKPALPHWKEIAKKGLTDFVGGVTDGKYGAAAFDFSSAHDPLKARKSWFFFDKEYVCLGAGITSEANYPVFTTLNQCLLNTDVKVKAKDGETTLNKGTHALENVSWVFQDGVAYLFPTAGNLGLSNTTATGNYREINHQAWATEEEVKKEVFTLWLDHGSKPQLAHYEYIVVPGIEASSINDYNKKSQITIASNTPEIQAVAHKGLNISYVVFYSAGKIKLSDGLTLTVDNPCMVMIKMNGKKIERITVSDPSRKLRSLDMKVTAQVGSSGANWKSVWDKKEKVSTIQVSLPAEGFAGQSVVLDTGF